MTELLLRLEKQLLAIRRLIFAQEPLTDADLRATPLDVNLVGGNVTIDSAVEVTNDAGTPITATITTHSSLTVKEY